MSQTDAPSAKRLSSKEAELLEESIHSKADSVLTDLPTDRSVYRNALAAISSGGSSHRTVAQVAETVIREVSRFLRAESGVLALLTEDGTQMEVMGDFQCPIASIPEWRRFPLSWETALSISARRGEPVLHPNRESYSGLYPLISDYFDEKGVQAITAFPIRMGDQVIGAISCDYRRERPLRKREATLVRSLLHEAAYALEGARLHDRLREARRDADLSHVALKQQRAFYEALRESHLSSEQTLQEIQQRLALHLTNSPLAAFEFDAQGRILFWSSGAERMFGWSASDVVGRTIQLAPPEEQHHVRDSVARLENGESHSVGVNFSVTRSGNRILCQWHYSALRDRQGNLLSILALAMDVTTQQNAQDTLREAALWQRSFLRDVLVSVTSGRLRLCSEPPELPEPLPEMQSFTLTPVTLRRFREGIRHSAQIGDLPVERVHDLVLGSGEASMNAVVHAGGGIGKVGSDPETGMVQVRISDYGRGIALDQLHRATLEAGFTTTGTLGHGFFLMLHVCDRIYLYTGPTGTTVVLEQDRERMTIDPLIGYAEH